MRSNWQVNDQLLYVFSDAVSSVIVGDKTEDVLRAIPYEMRDEGDTFHFEPDNIHCKALGKALFKVIETELEETDGQPVNFENGDCTVTLHFKRDVLAA